MLGFLKNFKIYMVYMIVSLPPLLNGANQKCLGFVSDYFEINLLQEI